MDANSYMWFVFLGIPGGLVLVAKSPPTQDVTHKVMMGLMGIFMLGPIVTILACIYRNDPTA